MKKRLLKAKTGLFAVAWGLLLAWAVAYATGKDLAGWLLLGACVATIPLPWLQFMPTILKLMPQKSKWYGWMEIGGAVFLSAIFINFGIRAVSGGMNPGRGALWVAVILLWTGVIWPRMAAKKPKADPAE